MSYRSITTVEQRAWDIWKFADGSYRIVLWSKPPNSRLRLKTSSPIIGPSETLEAVLEGKPCEQPVELDTESGNRYRLEGSLQHLPGSAYMSAITQRVRASRPLWRKLLDLLQ